MKSPLRIVFMGTPEFAVATLEQLVSNGYNVVGVITAPDRKAGRGRQISTSAVKDYALANGLNILQPTNLKSEAFLETLRALKADLQVVVAFRMLPVAVWDMPPMGTINLHASLLPEYRGAAPINWAVINGETQTGVTTFFIQHEIDTGDLLLQRKVPIGPAETAGELHDKLMTVGAELVIETLRELEAGTLTPKPQEFSGRQKKAPKLFKEDGSIDWFQPAEAIFNKIRGLSPYPGAYTTLFGKMLKIYKAENVLTWHTRSPGSVEKSESGELRFYASNGYLVLKEVQLEGKKRMTADEFLRGYNWPEA